MAGKKRYVVTAPLVILTDETGAAQYAYAGREINFETDQAKLAELADIGFLAVIPDGEDDPASLAIPQVFEGPPAKSADLATWRAFAASELGGMPAEEAATAKKKDLVEKYLGGDTEGTGDDSDE